MKLWKTIDKYFSTEEISEIFNDKNFKPFTTQWYSIGSLTPFQTKLIDGAQEAVASSFKSLSDVIGVEQWTHDASMHELPELHFDKDESLYEKSGDLRYPILSIILYLTIDSLKGADLFIVGKSTQYGETTVIPEAGKVVYIAPGVLHGVSPYISGKRISVNMNLWDYDVRSSK